MKACKHFGPPRASVGSSLQTPFSGPGEINKLTSLCHKSFRFFFANCEHFAPLSRNGFLWLRYFSLTLNPVNRVPENPQKKPQRPQAPLSSSSSTFQGFHHEACIINVLQLLLRFGVVGLVGRMPLGGIDTVREIL